VSPTPTPTVATIIYYLSAAGGNSSGCLGLGSYATNVTLFSAVNSALQFSKIAPGRIDNSLNYSKALSANTTKWYSTGRNNYGQLGIGNANSGYTQTQFTQIPGDFSVMYPGYYHTMAISANTTKLFACGGNVYGEFGNSAEFGDGISASSFIPITGNWSDVVCSVGFTYALSAGTNGNWFSTGNNNNGQLGTGAPFGYPNKRNTFASVSGNWDKIVMGWSHVVALSAGTGSTWFVVGENIFGGLGLGDYVDRSSFVQLTGQWSKIACCDYSTIALSAGTTKLFATGLNSNGELGLGSNAFSVNRFTPLAGDWSDVRAWARKTFALSAYTTKWYACGSNSSGDLGWGNTVGLSSMSALPVYQPSDIYLGTGTTFVLITSYN
jgi:alpha-tubulin suppressor-like RCC1 family protein